MTGAVSHIADRVAVMNHGKIVEHGWTQDIINNPQDPYTQELIAAVPVPGRHKNKSALFLYDVAPAAMPISLIWFL